jgi:prevent-host-death family protein
MHDAKSNLSRLVERAVAGEDVVIARAGKPVARLVPYEEYERATPRPFGLSRDRIWVADDIWEPDEELEAIIEERMNRPL